MQPWFLWKNESSIDRGLWVSELPAPTRAEERVEEITVPGRAGSLLYKEGDSVHNGYVREVKVTVRSEADFAGLLTWLSGGGQAVFSNEIDRVYEAQITGEVKFSRDGNALKTAVIPFYVHPHKGQIPPEPDIAPSDGGTIYNPGTVASRPLVTVTFTSSCTVSIAGQEMTFTAPDPPEGQSPAEQTICVDCDAQIITDSGGIWEGTSTGDFWLLPTGSSEVELTGATISVKPRWRWF